MFRYLIWHNNEKRKYYHLVNLSLELMFLKVRYGKKSEMQDFAEYNISFHQPV